MLRIFIDSREKARAIRKICATFDRRGVIYRSTKLFVGDYQRADNAQLVIDRKQNLLEVSSNVCQQHDRFIREIQRANDMDIRLVFLIEHGPGVRTLDDVAGWINPRLKDSPLAMSGPRLHKIMATIGDRYGVRWEFCTKQQTGDRIIEILTEGGASP